MHKYRAIIGITISAVGILVLLAFSQFELYPETHSVPAAREIRANPFYTLEKWLSAAGCPIRIDRRSGDASRNVSRFIRDLGGRESVLLLESTLFDWYNPEEELLPWVEEGGSLIVSLSTAWDGEADADLFSFLEGLGIMVEDGMDLIDSTDSTDIEETGEADADDADVADDTGTDGADIAIVDETETERGPWFNWRFRFSPTENPAVGLSFVEDQGGVGRLATLPWGKGSLTVIGGPYFMYNNSLKEEANARLAWELTAGKARAERPGVLLVVQGGRALRSLTGRLMERGNLAAPLLAALVLILVGFWMVIPSFGIPRREKLDNSPRTIRERFRAEAQFLKKHRALKGYLEAYVREIESRGRNRETRAALAPVKAALSSEKKLNNHEAIRHLETLMDVLERL
jgi:hypothetical protein